MVAMASPRLGFVPEVNLARSFLLRAHTKLEAGDVIAAGVLLREGVIAQVQAMCAWFDCEPKIKKPKRKKYLRPTDYIAALEKAGKLGDCAEWVRDSLECGNQCAHAAPVKANMVATCLSFMHCIIDGCPCGEPTDRPTMKLVKPAKDCDCGRDDDEDDGADWWKGGAV